MLPLACWALLAAPADPPRPIDVAAALETTLADAVAKARPAVVAITRTKGADPEVTTAVRGRAPRPAPAGPQAGAPADEIDLGSPDHFALPGDFGSGVVIGEKGEILTAFHVVKGAAQIRVRAPDHQEFFAEVLAADPRSDLAVIAPKDVRPSLTPIPIGDATKLRVGMFLMALGNPYNAARDGKASASWGILANTARRFDTPMGDNDPAARQVLRYQPTLLQLDTKLNLGMSGGAVINLRGELVGITTAAASPAGYDSQAGYAIPMDALGRRAVEALRQGKEVEYAFLGIGLQQGNANAVGTVTSGTPADRADLEAGDVIVAVDGRPLEGDFGLNLALAYAPVGRPVKLRIRRRDELLERSVPTSKYPISGEVIATNRPAPWRGLRVDYTSMLGGSAMADNVLSAMARGGVGIVEVEPGSPADAAGLRKGQVISQVEGQSVPTPPDFLAAVARLSGPVRLKVDRDRVVTVR